MASRPVMLLGNVASMMVAIAGILQALSWTLAGVAILAILSITTLAPTKDHPSGLETGHPLKKAGHTYLDGRQAREKLQERQTIHSHQAANRIEQHQPTKEEQRLSASTRPDFRESMAPRITPPTTVPAAFSPTKIPSTRPDGQKQEAIRPTPVGPTSTIDETEKPTLINVDPNSRVIEKDDFTTYDVELDQREEATCEVTASAPVNMYLMDEDNLDSFDLGEEFWSETGEEGVLKATLRFVAPQRGTWVLVVENTDNREVSATATIRKGRAKSESVP